MKKLFTLICSTIFTVSLIAQPSVMSLNQDVSGTYSNTATTLRGAVFVKRFQENGTGTATGTRNWQFNADGYFNTWGTQSSTKTLTSYDAVIAPSTATASANFVAAGYNAFGRLPATQPNYYYTYIIAKGNSYASQSMSVLETSFNPVTIPTVTQTPTGASQGTNYPVVVNITPSTTPNASEVLYVRYSTDNFATSTLLAATGSGTTWSAPIPAQVNGTTVKYYILTAESGSAITPSTSDFFTLELNNNGGTNYTYVTTSTLSIELDKIEVKKLSNSSLLTWLTASEKDNATFQIERSANATDFSPIGEVKGAGNSNAVKNYTFTDATPLSGVNYYRLKAVDYNGAATLSKIVSVNFTGKNGDKTAVYPNPVSDVLRVDYTATDAATTAIQVTDLTGRVIISQNVSVTKGANLLPLNIASLPSGAYLVKINNDITRFIKM
jgi:Secretion system C-terminal sorting domain